MNERLSGSQALSSASKARQRRPPGPHNCGNAQAGGASSGGFTGGGACKGDIVVARYSKWADTIRAVAAACNPEQ